MQKLYILIAFSLLTASCSQFSNAPTSKAWHNTNARFNSLIIARSNMKQAEKDLFDIFLIPGGMGTRKEVDHEQMISTISGITKERIFSAS